MLHATSPRAATPRLVMTPMALEQRLIAAPTRQPCSSLVPAVLHATCPRVATPRLVMTPMALEHRLIAAPTRQPCSSQVPAVLHATMDDINRLSSGIINVWVGGELVYSDKKSTGLRPGQVIRRTD